MNNTLYIVACIYNYKNDPLIYKVYGDFINRLKLVEGIEVYTAECLLPQQNRSTISHLNDKHFIYRISNPFINTHNLQNTVIKQLPNDWKYVIYLDSDIEFTNADWVEKTIEALNKYSIINPFTHATRMNINNVKGLRLRSFGYMFDKMSGTLSDKCNEGYFYDDFGGWWPGYAIAINREYYDNVGGLFDKTISGKNDIVTFNCAVDSINTLTKLKKSKEFFKVISEYRDVLKNFKQFKGVGFADNEIIHHYHGNYDNRNYDFMDSLYGKYEFNPKIDYTELPSGILDINVTCERQLNLRNELVGYFSKRFK